jgi:hypothetical protein
MYSLMTFGIPSAVIPITEDGALKPKRHLKWIANRRTLESQSIEERAKSASRDIILSSIDVLFGRGKGNTNHPGNLRLHLIMDSQVARYESCDRREKTMIAQDVVKEVKSRGARFLKQDNGIWQEVDENVARAKVSHAFRTRRHSVIESDRPRSDKNEMLGSEEETGNKKRSRWI